MKRIKDKKGGQGRAALPCCVVGPSTPHLASDLDSPTAAFVSPRRCVVSNINIGPPTSLWVGSPAAALVAPRCRPVSNVGLGLPMSLWAALPRRSLPIVVVWCRTSTLGCPRHCGQLCCDVRIPSSSSGVERRPWATHVVVGSPAVAFVSPRRGPVSNGGVGPHHVIVGSCGGVGPLVLIRCRCVVWVWDLGVVVGLAESGGRRR